MLDFSELDEQDVGDDADHDDSEDSESKVTASLDGADAERIKKVEADLKSVKSQLDDEKVGKVLAEIFSDDPDGLNLAKKVIAASPDAVSSATNLRKVVAHLVEKSTVLGGATEGRTSPTGEGGTKDAEHEKKVKAAMDVLTNDYLSKKSVFKKVKEVGA